jgi:5-(carboxyamino)imidazole ribonucleotide mutase
MNEIAVGILMGSQSDWATMKSAAAVLDELDISYETKIVSAHRTPERLRSYGGRRARAASHYCWSGRRRPSARHDGLTHQASRFGCAHSLEGS